MSLTRRQAIQKVATAWAAGAVVLSTWSGRALAADKNGTAGDGKSKREKKIMTYPEQKFAGLDKLDGLSTKQVEEHLKLYAGYVKNTNMVLEQLDKARADGKLAEPTVHELRRRLGWEFSGMRLHELYFSALGGAKAPITKDGALAKALDQHFGGVDKWVAELKSIGLMRGIGWALLVQDSVSGGLMNIWVSDHELGHLAGTKILVAMDVWEHAYTVDFAPTQRKDYIEKYFANLNWAPIEARFSGK